VGALLKPHESLFALRERNGVGTGAERSRLKASQAVDDDGQQRLLRDAVDPKLLDGYTVCTSMTGTWSTTFMPPEDIWHT
jgi:hypothetical protein